VAAIKSWSITADERWYLVRTKQQKEAIVQRKLSEFVDETFLPRMRTRRVRGSGQAESTTPLFPCYLFAFFDLESALYKVLHTIGVAGIVCAGSTPSEVDSSIIDEIRRRGEGGIVELPEKTLSAGQCIRVTDGPMEGLTGIFENYRSGSKRVALLLNIIGANVKVVVPAASVESAA
jgi:transcriptional antiterminator RfaH